MVYIPADHRAEVFRDALPERDRDLQHPQEARRYIDYAQDHLRQVRADLRDAVKSLFTDDIGKIPLHLDELAEHLARLEEARRSCRLAYTMDDWERTQRYGASRDI